MINLFDPVVQFCISFVTINVAEIGLKRLAASWNSHPIEGEKRNTKKAIKIIVIIIIDNNKSVLPLVLRGVAKFKSSRLFT